MSTKTLDVKFPPKLSSFMQANKRYKVLYGGRGGAKSHSFARDLIIKAAFKQLRVLCTREIQNTIKDSVYKLLVDIIQELELENEFIIRRDQIDSKAGSEIIFKGLRRNIQEIKSTEGIDICWIEEAEMVSERSWKILIPTIRKDDSQFWISFNPEEEDSPTYQRFIVNTPPDAIVKKINYTDNPWFPEVLRREMEYCKEVDFEAYEHIWEGKLKKYANALIFRGKYVVEDFDTPEELERVFFGLDWGYANDPLVCARMFIEDKTLYIDYDVGGVGIENEEIAPLLDTLPESRRWEIVADSARPELISYVRRQGFNIKGAKKGPGSVEDGIQFLRSFRKIVIHPRCKNAKRDFGNCKWKTDSKTNEVLPIPVKSFDHTIDLTRYALESYIKEGDLVGATLDYDPMRR